MIDVKDFKGGINGVPQIADKQTMWNRLKLIETESTPAVNTFVKALTATYTNGLVQTFTFKIEPDEIFDWFASRNQFHELGFFESFWGLPPVIKKTQLKLNELNFYSRDVFQQGSPFTLGGRLAWVLSSGGAYSENLPTPIQARDLGEAAARELIREDYTTTLVYESGIAWCNFFNDIAWDSTWIVINKTSRIVTVILATDTD